MLFRLYTIFPYVKIVTTSCEKLPAFLTDRNDAFAIPNAKANEVRPTTTYERQRISAPQEYSHFPNSLLVIRKIGQLG